MSADREMPRYRSHKEVHALEIASITPIELGKRSRIRFADHRVASLAYPPIDVDDVMFARYMPVVGDFYVVYSDGYASISPRKAFMEGYARILPDEPRQPPRDRT